MLAENGAGRTIARLDAKAKIPPRPLGLCSTVPRFSVIFFFLLLLVCVFFDSSALHGFLGTQKAHNLHRQANAKCDADHKANDGAESREALWSAAMTKAKCEADLNAKHKAESHKKAEVGEKARKEQEKATRAKAKADAGAIKSKAATKAEKASKRAKNAAKKANISSDKSVKLTSHAKGNEGNEPGLVNKFLYFVITCVFLLVIQLFF